MAEEKTGKIEGAAPPPLRLDKFLADQLNLTRKEARRLIQGGETTVNGLVVRSPDSKVHAGRDEVKARGEAVAYRRFLYLMLNKPQGAVCSTRDGLSPTVLSLLPENLRRKGLFPAGRLDKDTEGFVLLTDDGDLAHRILSPKNHVPKRYYVELELPFDPAYTAIFAAGIAISEGDTCLPAEIFPVEDRPDAAIVVLREGMFHQVKRMFEAVGNRVVFLKRLQIGGVVLDPRLPLGECRQLSPEEVRLLEAGGA